MVEEYLKRVSTPKSKNIIRQELNIHYDTVSDAIKYLLDNKRILIVKNGSKVERYRWVHGK